MKNRIKAIYNSKGVTLIELVLAISLVAIVFTIIFNMFSISTKSFQYVTTKFYAGEDIRAFLNTIQKEASQGKKAELNKEVLFKPSDSNNRVIYIYTDLDNDDIPELVRYRLDDNVIKKDYIKTSDKVFPFKYNSNFLNEKIVLSNVADKNIFGDVTYINTSQENYGDKDNRRKVKMTIEIETGNKRAPIIIDTYLVSKSRTEYE
ncbi:MAG: prepilin-type N-terminal cleavage/methylation domain-containing protein [Tissierellales bacterium]